MPRTGGLMVLPHGFIRKTQRTQNNDTKPAMAEKMATNRSQLDRVPDPDNVSIRLDTLIKAARAIGKVVEIKIRPAKKAVHA